MAIQTTAPAHPFNFRLWRRLFLPLTFLATGTMALMLQKAEHVGPIKDSGFRVATMQTIKPAGQALTFPGRPVDVALSPDGKTLYAKDNRGLIVIDTGTWKLKQELSFPKEGGASLHGIVVNRDGSKVWASGAGNTVWEFSVAANGAVSVARPLTLSGPDGKGASYPCGLALSTDEKTLFVCLSRNNTLARLSLESGQAFGQIPVGIAPFDVVLAPDGKTAYVSNWGGRRAKEGETVADSAGTPVPVDERGVASTGTIGVIDLTTQEQTREVAAGRHPSDLVLTRDGKTLIVANANEDTISVIDTVTGSVRHSLIVKPDLKLPFGSAPNALALSDNDKTLYVACGGNNAVAVVGLENRPMVQGWIPAGWYPGALALRNNDLYVANIKGYGSRRPNDAPKTRGWNVSQYEGVISKVPLPDAKRLTDYTRQVLRDSRVPEILRSQERTASARTPVPVPENVGDPSVFEHIVYIIKENRTYDQVFGDLKQGDGDPKLCIYGRDITPNHHALAEQFVLLDNFYCNGVLSADGHSWATEGNVTDHLEKAFGGFTRSYTFGDDPLTYSSSGFLWDNVLAIGRSFRNFGEMDYTDPKPAASFGEILKDWESKAGKITFTHKIGIARLKHYTAPDSIGWNMDIPDVLRTDIFLKEFQTWEKNGSMPNLTILYLPNDHTEGTSPGKPTPNAYMADNDLALGRAVEAISKSRFWPKTCIFVVEDDPQAGFDHVDGHRSIGLVISPYTRRGAVLHPFYNQTSVIHTIERILGVPAMNQMDAMSPLMTACFQNRPDLRPFTCLPNKVPLTEVNPRTAEISDPFARKLAQQSAAINFKVVDGAGEDELNRILWHAAKGTTAPYPVHMAGAHGKGLVKRGLHLSADSDDTED